MNCLRIFISSPGDVAEERDKAKQVIADLERRYADQLKLIPVLWEDLAIPATASFQEGIEFVLAERHRIDIAVFILWSRLGSPLGGAIKKPDGSSYNSGTEREFDLMLSAFEQSGGQRPVILAYTRRDDEAFNALLDARKYGVDILDEIIQQRKLVKQFIQERFQDKQGHNLRAYHGYREPVGFAQRLNIHLRETIDTLVEQDSTAANWTESPYRSLEVFDIRHAPIFCGRDEETCDLLQRLRDQQQTGCAFACIVGASGSGKSSLARAGVAATLLQRSFDDRVKEWRTAIFLPGLAAGNIFGGLTLVLAEALPELRGGAGGIERLAKLLEDQNHEAAGILIENAVKAASERLGGSPRILLVLDQLEELWTDRSITGEQREKFLVTIEALARSGRVSVLATLRSDFYSQAQLSPAFLRMKGERGHFDLTAPGTSALQAIIERPAQRAGLRFERDERTGRTLNQLILEDAARDPSALPLLEYALAELHERRDGNKRLLTFAAYRAMGGVDGALGQRAEQSFAGLAENAQSVLEELLPLLVSVDIGGEQNAVRRRARLSELTDTPGRRQLTERLTAGRFLTTDERGGTPIATLAHEALLRRWGRIANWINGNRDLLRMRARIEQYQAMWEESGRDQSRLLPAGLPLEEGRKLVSGSSQFLDKKAKDFILASCAVEEERQKQAEAARRAEIRKLRLGLAVFTCLAVIAALAAGLAALKWREATHARNDEIKQREIAETLLAQAKNARIATDQLIQQALYSRLRTESIGVLAAKNPDHYLSIAAAGLRFELTVEPRLQRIVDKALMDAAGKVAAARCAALLIDPQSGDILAIAESGNRTRTMATSLVSESFEPGTLLRYVPVAVALDRHIVRLNDMFDCENGHFAYNGKIIHDSQNYSMLAVSNILSRASGIGTAKMAVLVGMDKLRDIYSQFGFGSKSDVQLPYEQEGSLPGKSGLPAGAEVQLAMGQGFVCTGVQLTYSMAAVANGGTLMRPRLVRSVSAIDATGNHQSLITFQSEAKHRVISKDAAAATVTALMGVVSADGTGGAAAIKGVEVAGVTGTHVVVNPENNGNGGEHRVLSFLGFAPAS